MHLLSHIAGKNRMKVFFDRRCTIQFPFSASFLQCSINSFSVKTITSYFILSGEIMENISVIKVVSIYSTVK